MQVQKCESTTLGPWCFGAGTPDLDGEEQHKQISINVGPAGSPRGMCKATRSAQSKAVNVCERRIARIEKVQSESNDPQIPAMQEPAKVNWQTHEVWAV